MLALFVPSTLDGWSNLYHFAVDAPPEPHRQPLRESVFPGPLVRPCARDAARTPALALAPTLALTPTLVLTRDPDPNPRPNLNAPIPTVAPAPNPTLVPPPSRYP